MPSRAIPPRIAVEKNERLPIYWNSGSAGPTGLPNQGNRPTKGKPKDCFAGRATGPPQAGTKGHSSISSVGESFTNPEEVSSSILCLIVLLVGWLSAAYIVYWVHTWWQYR